MFSELLYQLLSSPYQLILAAMVYSLVFVVCQQRDHMQLCECACLCLSLHLTLLELLRKQICLPIKPYYFP